MKIAFVIDFLVQKGGAEYLLEVLCRIFPEAVIYTLLYDEKKTFEYFRKKNIIQPEITKNKILKYYYKNYHKHFLPIYPLLVERFDFRDFDLVISLSFLLSKNIITPASCFHLCYCLTPARHFWEMPLEYINQQKGFLKKIFVSRVQYRLRLWDEISSDRVDKYIAISDCVKNRIKKRYRTEAEILYPSYDNKIFFFDPQVKKEDFYLVSSRLVGYKKIDFAIEVFNYNKKKLIITSEGEDEKKLKKISRSNIIFTGYISKEELADLYRKAKALIFPGEEDFGISIINSLACGTPVIAYGKGAAVELINENISGKFFYDNSNPTELINIIEQFEKEKFNYQNIPGLVSKFSEKRFINNFNEIIKNLNIEKV